MPVYNWKARTRQGQVKKGVMKAGDDAAVMAHLRAQQLLPINVRPAPKDLLAFLPAMGAGVTTRELVVFTRQFSTSRHISSSISLAIATSSKFTPTTSPCESRTAALLSLLWIRF